jgi:integrase/recombinase XerD
VCARRRINGRVTVLCFFFTVTLDRADTVKALAFVAEPRKIPVVLDPEEVARFLEGAPGPKYKAAFAAAYGAGLRVSEVVALNASDIDSRRMLIRVEQGKDRKHRSAMLSPQLLGLLRDWYRIARPRLWLFLGRDPLRPLTTRRLNRVVPCPACGGRMIVVETFESGSPPHYRPTTPNPAIRIDTS